MMWDWHGDWWWLWGTLMMSFWVVVVAVAAFWVARGLAPRQGDRAREILDERYARGELSNDEYRERVDQLR
jgi:putative membrane protein